MFPVTGNNSYLGNIVPSESDLIIRAERLLADRLGQGWAVRRCDEPIRGPGTLQPDAILSMTAPDGSKALQMVEAKQRVFATSLPGSVRCGPCRSTPSTCLSHRS